MNRWYITLMFCLVMASLYGQTHYADSLKVAAQSAPSSQNQADALNYLSEDYSNSDLEQAKEYATQALLLSQKTEYASGVAHAYNNLGISHDYMGNADSALIYYQLGLHACKEARDTALSAVIKNNLGIYYIFHGNYPLALKYLQESLEESILEDYQFDPVATYSNIGIIHEEFGQTKSALSYYQKSADISFSFDDEQYDAFGYLSLGYIAYIKKDFQQAEKHYLKALPFYQKNKFSSQIAETLYYLGLVYEGLDQYDKALSHYFEALEIYKSNQSVSSLPGMYEAIGEVYAKLKQPRQAFSAFYKGKALSQKLDAPYNLLSIYEQLASLQASLGAYDSAYSYQLLYIDLTDTLMAKKSRERVGQMETAYEIALKQAENDKLKAERAERDAIIRQRTLTALGAGIIAILVGTIALVNYRSRREKHRLNLLLEEKVAQRTQELKAANLRLSQSNDELERFTYIASHDLKEPLRNITSFVNLIQRKLRGNTDQDLEDYLQFVVRGTTQLYQLIEDILAYSRISNVEEPEKVDLNIVVDKARETLSVFIREKGGIVEAETLPTIKAHSAHLFIIFKNLIENGLKYNESAQPKVTIRHARSGDQHHIRIIDNGIGIGKDYHKTVFKMFKRLNDRGKYKGSGIGLAICKKIVEKYGGEICISSNKVNGTTFHFTLPVAPALV